MRVRWLGVCGAALTAAIVATSSVLGGCITHGSRGFAVRQQAQRLASPAPAAASTPDPAPTPSASIALSADAVGTIPTAVPVPALPEPTATVWIPFTDHYGIIHSVPITDVARTPSDTNGLLFTAVACTIMQLRHASYDGESIAQGIKAYEVKPGLGLYRRSPIDADELEGPDDYIGLGALAGMCVRDPSRNFHDVARAILAYGEGDDQPSGSTALGLYPNDLAKLSNGLKQCPKASYNYNNVTPGKFNIHTWLGLYPAILVHLKIGAGERPTTEEYAIWSAALIYSGENDDLWHGKAHYPGKESHWFQDWLMVLTYEMSSHHSSVANFAVAQWWKKLHEMYPIDTQNKWSIQKTMRDYLGDHASGNPLGDYIEDFEGLAHPSADVESDQSAISLLGPLEGLLHDDCGSGQTVPCVNINEWSPTALFGKLTGPLSTSEMALDKMRSQVKELQLAVEHLGAAADKTRAKRNQLDKSITDLKAQATSYDRDKNAWIAKRAEWVAKKLSTLPGHWESPCVWHKFEPFGPCVRTAGPKIVWKPWGEHANPEFEKLVHQIDSIDAQLHENQGRIDQLERAAKDALGEAEASANKYKEVSSQLGRLQDQMKTLESAVQAGRGALDLLQAVAQNALPCGSAMALNPAAIPK